MIGDDPLFRVAERFSSFEDENNGLHANNGSIAKAAPRGALQCD